LLVVVLQDVAYAIISLVHLVPTVIQLKYEPSKDNPTFCACSFIKVLERIGIWEEIKGRLTVDDTHNLPALVEECEEWKEKMG